MRISSSNKAKRGWSFSYFLFRLPSFFVLLVRIYISPDHQINQLLGQSHSWTDRTAAQFFQKIVGVVQDIFFIRYGNHHFLQYKSKPALDAHSDKLSGNWAGSNLMNVGSQKIFAFIGGIRRKLRTFSVSLFKTSSPNPGTGSSLGVFM